MNEIVTSARSAREKLAAALALLQSPDAGDIIDKVAEPVARAMGALHAIESSGGQSAAEGGPRALDAVREALGAMQSVDLTNASLELAASQIAGSLGLVHALAQAAPALAPTAAQPQRFASSAPKASTPASPNFAKTTPSVAPPAEATFAKTSPSVTPSVSSGNLANRSVPAAPAGAGAFDKTAMASRSPVAHVEIAPQKAPVVPMDAPVPVIQQASPQQATPAPRSGDSKHAPAPSHGPSQGTPIIEANLGAHSPTNFYKGLSGNDVIVDGGLFVATYQIPPIGTKIWLKVTMPGGYDFEAGAQVRWSRDTGVGDASPGFGAALSDVSPEAKQLIYRYVRNREPLFHDDL